MTLTRSELRRWSESDVDSLVRNANNPRVAENLRDRFPSPYTEEDARGWISTAAAEEPLLHFATVVDGLTVGGIGLELQHDVHRRSAEIGYWLGEAHWGLGIMGEAVSAVTTYATTSLGLCRVFASVFDPNPASEPRRVGHPPNVRRQLMTLRIQSTQGMRRDRSQDARSFSDRDPSAVPRIAVTASGSGASSSRLLIAKKV